MDKNYSDIEQVIKTVLSFAVTEPSNMVVKIEPMNGDTFKVKVKTTSPLDAGRIIGKKGKRKPSVRDFVALCLKAKGYIESYDSIYLEIEGIR